MAKLIYTDKIANLKLQYLEKDKSFIQQAESSKFSEDTFQTFHSILEENYYN